MAPSRGISQAENGPLPRGKQPIHGLRPEPRTARYTPSENSHSAIGIPNTTGSSDVRPTTPNSTAAVPTSNSGAPIIPTTGSTRGTNRDQYNSGASSSALKAGIVLWLNRNTRSYSPTSACPAVCSCGGR